jgi:hypothetical protein
LNPLFDATFVAPISSIALHVWDFWPPDPRRIDAEHRNEVAIPSPNIRNSIRFPCILFKLQMKHFGTINLKLSLFSAIADTCEELRRSPSGTSGTGVWVNSTPFTTALSDDFPRSSGPI